MIQAPQPQSSVFPTVACHFRTRSLSGTLLLHSWSFRPSHASCASMSLCLQIDSLLLLGSSHTPRMFSPLGLNMNFTAPAKWVMSITPRSPKWWLTVHVHSRLSGLTSRRSLRKRSKMSVSVFCQIRFAVCENDQVFGPRKYVQSRCQSIPWFKRPHQIIVLPFFHLFFQDQEEQNVPEFRCITSSLPTTRQYFDATPEATHVNCGPGAFPFPQCAQDKAWVNAIMCAERGELRVVHVVKGLSHIQLSNPTSFSQNL